ncbi:MAG: hypothetical protein N2578_10230 [Bdellovibrionaceae bacterium]|nr:hypothetical protein [Pseudobdellovibrionaceae bacterium]
MQTNKVTKKMITRGFSAIAIFAGGIVLAAHAGARPAPANTWKIDHSLIGSVPFGISGDKRYQLRVIDGNFLIVFLTRDNFGSLLRDGDQIKYTNYRLVVFAADGVTPVFSFELKDLEQNRISTVDLREIGETPDQLVVRLVADQEVRDTDGELLQGSTEIFGGYLIRR